MQNELDVPAIETRRKEAREWARPNGHAEAPPDPPETSWWSKNFKWESLTMPSGRTIEKGFVVSPQIAGIFLVAFLGMVGWAYKSSTADSRETLIAITEMKTMLNERTRVFNEQQTKLESELKDERSIAALHREKAKEKQSELIYALKEKGIVINQ